MTIGLLFGPYELLEPLGSGGMGRLYKARDIRGGEAVALKLLPEELSGEPWALQRFEREARILEGLSHPNICGVHEYGVLDDGRAFIAMPFHDGRTLREIIAAGPLALDEALGIAIQIASGLRCAHEAGVVHRDIKPANVIVTASGVAKILDFGVAKEVSEKTLTNPNELLGTIAYMAPEQLRGEPVGPEADVWALGIVLFEMLAGRRPYRAEDLQQLAHAIAHGGGEPVQALDAAIGDAGRVLARMLERNPRARYHDMAELIGDLEQVGRPSTRLDRVRRRVARLARRPGVRVVAAVLLVALLGTFAFDRLGQHRRERWGVESAIPAARAHVEEGRYFEAFRILREAEAIAPDRGEIRSLLAESTALVTFETEPPGAWIRVRQIGVPDEWIDLGASPLTARVPAELCPIEVSHPGYRTRELFYPWPLGKLYVPLQRSDDPRERMFLVEEIDPNWGFIADAAGTFWMDELEVTNREFESFIREGGYARAEIWPDPILVDARPLPLDEARRRVFVDRTGRPGPATWSEGTWLQGEAELPVAGVSWYEAVAYCRARGLELPTMAQWKAAALPAYFFAIADRTGNFASGGPVAGGNPRRLGAWGGYDLYGNVWEWIWNEQEPGERYVMGGAWTASSHSFVTDIAERQWSRSPDVGFRCVEPVTPVSAAMRAPIRSASGARRDAVVLGAAEYEELASRYAYAPSPLGAFLESVDTSFEHWRVERVSYRAAYGEERIEALLYLPETATPPYSVVVYAPHAAVHLSRRPFELSDGELSHFLFFLRGGRAVLYPMCHGTYARHVDGFFEEETFEESLRRTVLDIRRSVDYLETRSDVDAGAIAYCGWGFGANNGPLTLAVESRFSAAVLISGGFPRQAPRPAVDAEIFAPRVRQPTLMVGGRHDPYCDLESQQVPMFESLGSHAKRHRIIEADRLSLMSRKHELVREILDWLDQHLGPVHPPVAVAGKR